MNELPPSAGPNPCPRVCTPASSVEALNSECFCVAVDPKVLHAELESILDAHGLPAALADSHPHMFAALQVYVTHQHIEQVAAAVSAIEEVTALPAYRAAVLSWAPEIAVFDPGSPGGLLGLDFHLGPGGPRLIEINTNPGGAMLNVILAQAQSACMPDLTVPPTDVRRVEDAIMESMRTEWILQRGVQPLQSVAIVDESPTQQYLYPEFLLYRQLFLRHGCRAEICDPKALIRKQGRLWLDGCEVDFIYNRLTDFAFQQAAHEALRASYLSGEVAVSPHPRAHALYADKRNMSLLGRRDFLQASGASQASIDTLAATVPVTRFVTSENREALWASRRQLFFKPAAGFGSKASYRGDKLTRRVWEEIAEGNYVAQEIVPPSERRVSWGADPLKVDMRCYAYRGEVLLYAARMYRGQTTNFRTPGGGFAPVLTERKVASATG